MPSSRFTEYLVAERKRYLREDTALGLIAFKLAQIVWQNGSGKGKQPEIGHYIPHLVKSPEDQDKEMMELCKMFNAAMGGADYEGGECADPEDLKKLAEKRKKKVIAGLTQPMKQDPKKLSSKPQRRSRLP